MFFDLLTSLGQQELIILLLRSGPNLGLRRVIQHSPIKLLSRIWFSINQEVLLDSCCCCIQKRQLMTPGVLAAAMDLAILYLEDYCQKGMHQENIQIDQVILANQRTQVNKGRKVTSLAKMFTIQ